MTVYCYPQPGKAKARKLCEDFARGCGDGKVVDDGQYRRGDAMFYGISPGMEKLLQLAQTGTDEGGTFYFADNSFFDETRQVYFRVAMNAVQETRVPRGSSGFRFDEISAKYGVTILPWQKGGRHVVVCPQSEHFMKNVLGYPGNWLDDTLRELRKHTDRQLRVRPWNRDKAKLAVTLPDDLRGAHALVTHSSAAAVTALLHGVPVFVTGPSVATELAGQNLSAIEEPWMPDVPRVLDWANGLANMQWTREEMQQGVAWQMLGSEFFA